MMMIVMVMIMTTTFDDKPIYRILSLAVSQAVSFRYCAVLSVSLTTCTENYGTGTCCWRDSRGKECASPFQYLLWHQRCFPVLPSLWEFGVIPGSFEGKAELPERFSCFGFWTGTSCTEPHPYPHPSNELSLALSLSPPLPPPLSPKWTCVTSFHERF